jgi:phospholipase C
MSDDSGKNETTRRVFMVGGAAAAIGAAAAGRIRPDKITDEQARLIDKVSAAIAGPVGLGFRTPALVISPFSAGGYKYSGTLDHTSTLRLIETRFGVTVPNLSAWRRSVTGDFTGALNLTSPPVTAVPALPSTSIGSNLSVVEEAVLNALTGTLDVGLPHPLPTSNSMPAQETTPVRPRSPSQGAASHASDAVDAGLLPPHPMPDGHSPMAPGRSWLVVIRLAPPPRAPRPAPRARRWHPAQEKARET